MGLLLLMGRGWGGKGGFGHLSESLGCPGGEIPTQERGEGEHTWLRPAMPDSALLTLQSLQL